MIAPAANIAIGRSFFMLLVKIAQSFIRLVQETL